MVAVGALLLGVAFGTSGDASGCDCSSGAPSTRCEVGSPGRAPDEDLPSQVHGWLFSPVYRNSSLPDDVPPVVIPGVRPPHAAPCVKCVQVSPMSSQPGSAGEAGSPPSATLETLEPAGNGREAKQYNCDDDDDDDQEGEVAQVASRPAANPRSSNSCLFPRDCSNPTLRSSHGPVGISRALSWPLEPD